MASNIYTKNEILQILASKGYFIDIYTLETFFTKWNIEAIFEDEQGGEFFDKNALDQILNNLFNTKEEETKPVAQEETAFEALAKNTLQNQNKPQVAGITTDAETQNILNNISLSDGSNLMDKVQQDFNIDVSAQPTINTEIEPIEIDSDFTDKAAPKKKLGILEGAMQTLDENTQQEIIQNQELRNEVIKEIEETEKTLENFNNQTEQIVPQNQTLNLQQEIPPMPALPIETEPAEEKEFDDISLISDSLEAQEKFKEYVVNEIAKDKPAPQQVQNSNEFKLDISERTINMVARTMAKKIAKHVSAIYSADAKSAAQLEEMKQENKRLEQKTKELESQNKKLRLLLAESNKNLNSYKPSIFGLYKKVPPQ